MTGVALTTVDLIRHGEPGGGHRYRGWTDDPLSERGWDEMRDAVGDHCPWQRIVSSPLARCRVFAEELSARHGLPLRIESDWREMGFGEWEGRTAKDLLARDTERVTRFWQNPVACSPPGGESFADFRERVAQAWESLLADGVGQHLLVVAHGGTIRMVLGRVLGMPLEHLFRVEIPHASVTRVGIASNGMMRLVFHNGRL